MTDKKLDIAAFVGTGFDMYARGSHKSSEWKIVRLSGVSGKIRGPSKFKCYVPQQNEACEFDSVYFPVVRPRLFTPQVLEQDQYAKLPDGFVWNIHGHSKATGSLLMATVFRSDIKRISDSGNFFILSIECIGAEPAYSKDAKRLGVPVIGGEV